jgi:hypothetical protein
MSSKDLNPPGGLCARCAYARTVENARGSIFILCGRSFIDPRFQKYPRLPVLRCDGFDERDEQKDHPSPSS